MTNPSTSTPAPVRRGPTPLDALRKRWWLAATLPLLLAVLGYTMGLAKPPTYTAEARVAVGAGSLTSGAIAGFPEAAGTLAANYARYVNSNGVTDSSVSTQGVTLNATPIPESYVISIQGQGADQAKVVAATQRAADQLVKTVNSGKGTTSPDTTLAQYRKLSTQWADAKAASDAAASTVGRLNGKAGEAAARQAAAQAQAKVADLQVQMDALSQKYSQQVAQASTDADLTVVRKADVTGSSKSGTAQQYLLAGLVVGALLALALAWLLERLSGRARTAARADHRADKGAVAKDAPAKGATRA